MLDDIGQKPPGDAASDPLLILIPAGQDAIGAAALLRRDGVACTVCADLPALLAALGEAAGAVLIAEEALGGAGLATLSQGLGTQPPWSDLPFIVLLRRGPHSRRVAAEHHVPDALGNVMFLEYPLSAMGLISTVRSALRARRRQRQVAEHLAQRGQIEAQLRASEAVLEIRIAQRTAELEAAEESLRQAQKMEAIGLLTGGIAHDFNNMLQAISGCLQVMQRRIDKGRIGDIVDLLDSAGQTVVKAAALTHRLLAFARRQALQPKSVEPDDLVKSMSELIGRTVGPQIDLDLSLHNGIWSVLCDPNQLESALLNLAINARDAMPQGGRLVFSSADLRMSAADVMEYADAAAGDYVKIAVSDTGVGMSKDVLQRAFEPFFTTKPHGQGTGLGLSQLYGFVRQSGGFVRLESVVGRGTTVSLYLPRFAGEAGQDLPGAEPVRRPGEACGTVLIVEDETDVRANLVEAVRELGCRVIEAQDGPSGLQVLQSGESVDLLVTDVGLPGLNGRQLAAAARERRPNMPVVLITGYAGVALEDWSLDAGMEVLNKPFLLNALQARVGCLLKLHSAT